MTIYDSRLSGYNGQKISQAAELHKGGRFLLVWRLDPGHATEIVDLQDKKYLANKDMLDVTVTPQPDAGVPDAGVPDAGVPDAGVPDAGVPDAGVPLDASGADDARPTHRLRALGPEGGVLSGGCGIGSGPGFIWTATLLVLALALALRRRRRRR